MIVGELGCGTILEQKKIINFFSNDRLHYFEISPVLWEIYLCVHTFHLVYLT